MSRHFSGLTPLILAASLIVGGFGGPVAQAQQPANPVIKVVELNTWYRAALVDREATRNPRDLEAIARQLCEGLEVCRAGLWIDEFSMPNAMPVRVPQMEAQEYAFGRNPKGEESSLWNCNKYPEFEAENACLPRVMR